MDCGTIQPNDVVELIDDSGRQPATLQSGDFLLVRSIVETVQTEDVKLRGYRLRRCKYYQPMFESITDALNDLFLLIDVNIHDDASPWDQGLENVSVDQVIKKRECNFTNMDHKGLGLGHLHSHHPPHLRDNHAIVQWLFDEGKLICRWVHIREREGNGTPYGGIVRRLYKRESAGFSPKTLTTPSVQVTRDNFTPISTASEKHKRNRSIEMIENPTKRRRQLPSKKKAYAMGDFFCGLGGTSEGARSAGWQVSFGIENDPSAMEAYRRNFPGSLHFEMDAHDFPAMVKRCKHGVDLTHFSCPCQYWSDLQ